MKKTIYLHTYLCMLIASQFPYQLQAVHKEIKTYTPEECQEILQKAASNKKILEHPEFNTQQLYMFEIITCQNNILILTQKLHCIQCIEHFLSTYDQAEDKNKAIEDFILHVHQNQLVGCISLLQNIMKETEQPNLQTLAQDIFARKEKHSTKIDELKKKRKEKE